MRWRQLPTAAPAAPACLRSLCIGWLHAGAPSCHPCASVPATVRSTECMSLESSKPHLSTTCFAGNEAGEAYMKLAEVHLKLESKHDAASSWVEASKALLKSDQRRESLDCCCVCLHVP